MVGKEEELGSPFPLGSYLTPGCLALCHALQITALLFAGSAGMMYIARVEQQAAEAATLGIVTASCLGSPQAGNSSSTTSTNVTAVRGEHNHKYAQLGSSNPVIMLTRVSVWQRVRVTQLCRCGTLAYDELFVAPECAQWATASLQAALLGLAIAVVV